jgi:anaerobic selenocysteine-containing dehydrogenase
VATGMMEIAGLYPPNRLAAEILADQPERLHAMLIDSSNPANSAANTAATEKALRSLDLLVVVDVAMTETARLADYVLPASSQFEKWEFTMFNFSFPTNYFHLRRPIFDPLPGTRIEPEIYAALARRLGLLPDETVIEELRQQAATDRLGFSLAVMKLAKENPVYGAVAPLILYLTLGKTLPDGAAVAAILWPACHKVAGRHTEAVQRALGVDTPPPMLGEVLFDRLLTSPSGTPFTRHTMDDIWSLLAYPDGKFRLEIPEMLDWLGRLDPADDAPDADYPFVVSLGQRRRFNANQIVRSPKFRRQDYDGALRIHPDDLNRIGASDGGWVTVETRTGQLTVRAEADDGMRLGYAVLPQGYGMEFAVDGGERVTVGPRINLLTASDYCDPLTDTPYHKTVPAALRAASNEEAAMSEEVSAKVKAFVAAG